MTIAKTETVTVESTDGVIEISPGKPLKMRITDIGCGYYRAHLSLAEARALASALHRAAARREAEMERDGETA